ncbi:DNA/RNA nuclease SfsA [Idiomarina abyssalis]|uniref:DNA/RNA nuclease SfsA n=1 Tax=Idiomarina abyssalis TaxID=86102 RepID=UPI0006C891E9|nr:DNA/RNA nuclease SfsA [Idiomarina abyssalis]KPD21518.1 transcriptional regulator [Idiomarina abyssalis]SFT61760.1 sugar fermentation stimulation protein A [Idiomarina abyssalis]
MQFNKPLRQGVLQKRYKRFLADIDFGQGDIITAHCPNTGAMTGCAQPGFKAWCSVSDNPKRKYSLTWELAQNGKAEMIVVNTQHANRMAGELLQANLVPELSQWQELKPEQRYGREKSRIDWWGIDANRQECFIEVKSVTLADDKCGYFPDAVSQRAHKHLNELMQMTRDGHRAIQLYMVMHQGIESVTPAKHIDPKYAELCKQAESEGVEFYAVKCVITPQEIKLERPVPVTL